MNVTQKIDERPRPQRRALFDAESASLCEWLRTVTKNAREATSNDQLGESLAQLDELADAIEQVFVAPLSQGLADVLARAERVGGGAVSDLHRGYIESMADTTDYLRQDLGVLLGVCVELSDLALPSAENDALRTKARTTFASAHELLHYHEGDIGMRRPSSSHAPKGVRLEPLDAAAEE